MFRSTRAQGWTVDYAVSLLIFVIAALLAVKIIGNTFISTEFQDIKENAIIVSNHLLSKGNPEHWVEGDAVRVGLTRSGNRINKAKLRNYIEMDYGDTKTLFGISDEYAFYFEYNNTVVGVEEECVLGSLNISEVKNIYNKNRKSAYYHRSETFISSQMADVGADFYDAGSDSEINNFYDNIEEYEFILMEDPGIIDGSDYSNIEKKDMLEEFVRNGGLLFLTENVSMNLTGVGFNIVGLYDSNVTNDTIKYLNMTVADGIIDNDNTDSSFSVTDISSSSFAPFLNYSDGSNAGASWNYGIGSVYYFHTANADYVGSSTVSFSEKIGESVKSFVNMSVANCTSIGINSIDSENIARIDRLAIMDSKVMNMVVLAWS